MKADEINLLRPLWMPNSFEASEDCKSSLKQWLIDGSYNVINSDHLLSLHCQGDEEIRKCLSFDAFRFATHSAQTVYELQNTKAYAGLTSWRVIQSYYAAYFAAHAVLRFFGRSFSHLEPGHVRFLKDRCTTEAAFTPALPSGYYEISYISKEKIVNFTKFDESHRDLWRCFHRLLVEISNDCLSLTAIDERRQDMSRKFTELAYVLTDRGKYMSGNWLSVVRNEVNYKSPNITWYPFTRATIPFTALMSKVKNWKNCDIDAEYPDTIKSNWERYFITSFLVVDLALSISTDFQRQIGKPGNRSSSFSRLINEC